VTAAAVLRARVAVQEPQDSSIGRRGTVTRSLLLHSTIRHRDDYAVSDVNCVIADSSWIIAILSMIKPGD
jgi:hypothetical protein